MSILAGISPDAIDDTEEEAPAKGSDAAKRAEAVRVAILTELKVRGPLRYSEILEALPMVRRHHLLRLQKESRAVCTGRAKAARWSLPGQALQTGNDPRPVLPPLPRDPRIAGVRERMGAYQDKLSKREMIRVPFCRERMGDSPPRTKAQLVARREKRIREDKEKRANSFRDTLIRKRESLARKITAIDAFLHEFYG